MEYGIISPLTVVATTNGNYDLVDGERRFRAAQKLNLKEVPVEEIEVKDEVDRMLKQFHIQEQREGWTGAEKAIAIEKLSKYLELTPKNLCEMLGVPARTVSTYLAFSKIINKEAFRKNNISLEFSGAMNSLSFNVRKIKEEKLGEEFTRQDQKDLESSIIKGIVKGDITKGGDIVKIKDSFTKEPKLIKSFLENPEQTPASLFIKSKAQSAFHLRNATTSANYVTSHLNIYLQTPDTYPSKQAITSFKDCRKKIEEFLSKIED